MPRILVVDDSPTILKVVSAILARSGIESASARDGVAGLSLLSNAGPFDLILLDFVMPKMNGYQFCRELRKDAAHGALPVVLMSAKSDKIRSQFVQQTGALDAITKPFDARTLVAVVEGVLAKVKAGRGQKPPAPEAMPEEESLGEESEPRPSILPRRFEERASQEISQHVCSRVVPALLDMKEGDRGRPDALHRTITRALESAPLDALMLTLREIASATNRDVLAGDMTSVPIPEVLQLLQMQRQTGVMTVVNGQRSSKLFMRDGQLDLACVTGEGSELRLGRYFVEAGIKRVVVEEAALAGLRKKTRLGDELVASGKVTEEERVEALTKQSCEIVYDLVRWQRGRFWFVRDPPSPEAEAAHLSLSIAPLMLEGFRRVDEWRVMEGTIVWEEVIVIDEAALQRVGASLTLRERKVLTAVDGRRTISEIVEDLDVPRFEALKLLYQFLSSRVLRSIPTRSAEVVLARPSQMPPARPVEEHSTTEGSLQE